jgi:hypothetical protein
MDSTQFYSLCVCKSCSCVGGVKCEAFRNIGNKFFSYEENEREPKSNLGDEKQQAEEIQIYIPL